MKKQITEAKANALRKQLQRIEQEIKKVNKLYGEAIRDEGVLDCGSTSTSLQHELIRLGKAQQEIADILCGADILRIDRQSDKMNVQVGDIVAAQVTYEGEEPMDMRIQIDGLSEISGITNVTLASPMGRAILGKTVGENFLLRKSSGSPVNADGVITGIVKAKDLAPTMGEIETKNPYTLKHS